MKFASPPRSTAAATTAISVQLLINSMKGRYFASNVTKIYIHNQKVSKNNFSISAYCYAVNVRRRMLMDIAQIVSNTCARTAVRAFTIKELGEGISLIGLKLLQ